MWCWLRLERVLKYSFGRILVWIRLYNIYFINIILIIPIIIPIIIIYGMFTAPRTRKPKESIILTFDDDVVNNVEEEEEDDGGKKNKKKRKKIEPVVRCGWK